MLTFITSPTAYALRVGDPPGLVLVPSLNCSAQAREQEQDQVLPSFRFRMSSDFGNQSRQQCELRIDS